MKGSTSRDPPPQPSPPEKTTDLPSPPPEKEDLAPTPHPADTAKKPTADEKPPAQASVVLPAALENMDNREAWLHVRGHLLSTPGNPLVIWGPTGCGKTYGVRALLSHLFPSFTVVELDGAEEDHVSTCLATIARARESHQRAVVFLDDFESFLPNWRSEMARVLFGHTSPHLSPLVITSTQVRSPDNKALRPLHSIRLRAPQASTLTKFFSSRYGLARVLPHRSLCAHGDIRRLEHAIALDLIQPPPTTTRDSNLPHPSTKDSLLQLAPSNMFEATRGLILKDCPATLWAQYASSLDVALLQEHLMHHVNVQAMGMVSDNFSWTDTSPPPPLQYQTLVAAKTATLTSRPRDVGAIAPRPREPKSDSRKREMADVPAILGGTICKRGGERKK